ncbi:MAG: outer membrane beta-barrel protein [Alphaproteobacteria bacterium]
MRISGILTGAALAASLATGTAEARDQIYIGGSMVVDLVSEFNFRGTAGTTSYETDFDPAFGLEGHVGYDFGNPRLEAEIAYRTMDVDTIAPGSGGSGDMGLTSVIGSVFYDFENETAFTPYVGAGAGIVFFSGDASFTNINGVAETEEFDTIAPALQGQVGARYEVADDVSLTGGYNLMIIPTSDDNEDNTMFVNGIKFGVDVAF